MKVTFLIYQQEPLLTVIVPGAGDVDMNDPQPYQWS